MGKGYEARRAYLEEVNFNPPKLEDLMAKVERGALMEDPDEAVARFHAARLKEEQWQKEEAEERAAEIELVKKQYEELAEREKNNFRTNPVFPQCTFQHVYVILHIHSD